MHGDVRSFLGYSSIGGAIFGCEMLGFVLLIKYTDIEYIGATVITFLFAITAQYFITRRYVFSKTDRGWQSGYVFFFTSAAIGATLVTSLMIGFVEYLEVPPLISRIVAAGVVGYFVYLFNLHMTFRTPRTIDPV